MFIDINPLSTEYQRLVLGDLTGHNVMPVYQFDRADVILSVGG